MSKKTIASALLVVAIGTMVGSVALVTLTVISTPAEAARCICPQVYAPVTCSNGKTYPNQCVADCRHARNCVPSGI